MPPTPELTHIYTATVELAPPLDLGATPHGHRLIVPITGGALDGPRISAKVLPGGADWIAIRSDGVAELDVRATVETHDGALIYVTIRGYLTNLMEVVERLTRGETVPDSDYSFVMSPAYETSDPRYDWLQRTIAVAKGVMLPNAVRYDVFGVMD